MLWVGNVAEAIDCLKSLKGSKEIKSGGELELDKAVKYLEGKQDRIPCYALRKWLGLRCTSNSVEIANNILVARRQKKKGVAWSDKGTYALGSLTAVFENDESEAFFIRHVIPFVLRKRATDRGRRTGIDWIVDREIQVRVLDEVRLFVNNSPQVA